MLALLYIARKVLLDKQLRRAIRRITYKRKTRSGGENIDCKDYVNETRHDGTHQLALPPG